MRHCCQFEGMKQASLLQRIGTYLLGLVDEYWPCVVPGSTAPRSPSADCSAMAIIASAQTEPSAWNVSV